MRTVRWLALTVAVVLAAAGGFAWMQGYRIYIVHTGSMIPTAPPGAAVIDAPAPASVRPGEIVTFRYRSGPDPVVTHRVVSSVGGVVHTKGDGNRTVDPWTLRMSQVVGTAIAVVPRLGYALVYLRQPTGLASLITGVVGLALLWQLFFPSGAAPPSAPSADDSQDQPPPDATQARHRRPAPRFAVAPAARYRARPPNHAR